MHFLDGTELTRDRLTSLLDRALTLKGAPAVSRAQAENRRHAQKALLELLVSNASRSG